jgi:hypothetical protein
MAGAPLQEHRAISQTDAHDCALSGLLALAAGQADVGRRGRAGCGEGGGRVLYLAMWIIVPNEP